MDIFKKTLDRRKIKGLLKFVINHIKIGAGLGLPKRYRDYCDESELYRGVGCANTYGFNSHNTLVVL